MTTTFNPTARNLNKANKSKVHAMVTELIEAETFEAETFEAVTFNTPDVDIPAVIDNSANDFLMFRKIVEFFKVVNKFRKCSINRVILSAKTSCCGRCELLALRSTGVLKSELDTITKVAHKHLTRLMKEGLATLRIDKTNKDHCYFLTFN